MLAGFGPGTSLARPLMAVSISAGADRPAVWNEATKGRETMATGTVKVYSSSRGSGWIRPDSGGNAVYVHKSGIVRDQEDVAPRLEKGQRVEFQIGQRPKGPSAINVRPATGDAAVEPEATVEAEPSGETAPAAEEDEA